MGRKTVPSRHSTGARRRPFAPQRPGGRALGARVRRCSKPTPWATASSNLRRAEQGSRGRTGSDAAYAQRPVMYQGSRTRQGRPVRYDSQRGMETPDLATVLAALLNGGGIYAAKKVLDVGGGLSHDLLKPAADELGQQLARWVKRRDERASEVGAQALAVIQASGLPQRPVSPKLALRILECAALEEDEAVRTTWAAMLANAGVEGARVHPAFIEVLNSLSPLEVQLLHQAFPPSHRKDGAGFCTGLGSQEFKDLGRQYPFETGNLVRLRVIEPPAPQFPMDAFRKVVSGLEQRTSRASHQTGSRISFNPLHIRDWEFRLSDQHRWSSHTLTTFGASFLDACDPPVTIRQEPDSSL